MTHNESVVYDALVRLGGSSGGKELLELTGFHRNIIYECLGTLEAKGFTQEKSIGAKKVFQITDAKVFTRTAEKYKNTADQVQGMIHKFVKNKRSEVVTYEGKEGWQRAWQDVMIDLKPKSEFYTVGMAGDLWVENMGETYIQYEKWAEKNKIVNHIVAQPSLEKEIKSHQGSAIRRVSYVKQMKNLEPKLTIEIFPSINTVFLENYDNQSTLVAVKSEELSYFLKGIFDILNQ